MLLPEIGAAQSSLPRSIPEAEGVSSEGIESFLDAISDSGYEVHSFMLLRHGKVVAEGWWNPYGPDRRHVMFSASKSITSMGIGMAVDEGRLKLDDKVVSFFPEFVTDSVSPAMRQLTVRHLLTMSVGQEREAMRGNGEWVRAFLNTPPVHEPGSVFMYNNMATFVLSAIVQKVTGQRLFDYLEPRLFQPLGIQNITWDINPQGITVGMIGSRLHTEDLAKLGQLMLQKGNWNGRQLISEAYVEAASSFHIGNNPNNVPPELASDGQLGYGFQFWRGHNNSFRLDGLGGQLSIVLPDQNAVVVLTSNVRNIPDELKLVWQHLVPAMKDEPLPVDPAAQARLSARLASLEIPAVAHTGSQAIFSGAGGRRFELEENAQGVRAVSFDIENGVCELTIERPEEVRNLRGGVGTWRYAELKARSLMGTVPEAGYNRSSNGTTPDTSTVAAVSCGMRDEDTLEISSRFIEDSLGAETWTVDFEESGSAVAITTGAARPGGQPRVLRGRSAEAPGSFGGGPGR